jgi:hypothetical protein
VISLDPNTGPGRAKDCIDGGGRRGPTLLAEIARRKGDQAILIVTDDVLEDLAATVGHAAVTTTVKELREMEARGTVMTFSKTVYSEKGRVTSVLDSVGLTTKGREYLTAK